jgi:hypothetical protein
MSKAVMQQALRALEAEAAIYMDNDPEDGPPEAMTDAIRTLRTELAKPGPENMERTPVWRKESNNELDTLHKLIEELSQRDQEIERLKELIEIADDVLRPHIKRLEELLNESRAREEKLCDILESVRQYGSDTLSGRVDGPDDRAWQRASVLVMTNRAGSYRRLK